MFGNSIIALVDQPFILTYIKDFMNYRRIYYGLPPLTENRHLLPATPIIHELFTDYDKRIEVMHSKLVSALSFVLVVTTFEQNEHIRRIA